MDACARVCQFVVLMGCVAGVAWLAAHSGAQLAYENQTTVVFNTKPAKNAPGAHGTSLTTEQLIDADQALKILKRGNERFVSGQIKHPHEDESWRHQLVRGQRPIATVLGCSDSRVSPELIFDEGLGDLFVIRVAGNVVDEDVEASIEYAVEHLDTHLIIVLGHENCGAVTAALHHGESKEPAELNKLIRRIHDNVCEHHDGEPDVSEDSTVSLAVEKNVLCGTRQLKECHDLFECIKHHDVKVVGAIYDLESGRVRWIE